MRFAAEVVTEAFLPTVRSMLVSALLERGHTQREVAGWLGLSQSAVSKHAHGAVERTERIERDDRVQELVERLAGGLSSGELRPVDALVETEACIRALERGGVLAELHAESMPGLTPERAAAIHDTDGRPQESVRVRASVRRGVRVLQNTGGFAGHIPAVGSNLAECLSDAATVEDVAAVPGRILDVGGQVTVPGEPEFGVSQHVAGLLLAARQHGSDARAAANVRYDPALRDGLVAAGHPAAEFDAEADLTAAVGETLGAHPDATVLYQTGGFGVEPVLYVLGPDASTVARRLREAVDG